MTQTIDTPASLLAALEGGESLPAHWYTDPAITEREIAQIFRRSWNYVGPLSQLTALGDYVTGYAGGVPVVVVRNEGGLAGFVNVCRHRRHEVMKGRGNAKAMQCGYHAWTYDLTGALRSVPRSAAEPNFRLKDFPLLPIRAEALGPFVFVNLDPEAPSVQTCYGPILGVIAKSGVTLEALEVHSREEWQSHANWKTMLENYLECYHCAVAHPGFNAAIDVRPDAYKLEAHGWFSSQSGEVRPAALQGKTKIKLYDVSGAVAQSQYHFLWPSMTININPGFPNLSVDVWTPDGPNKTTGFSEQFFGPGVSEEFAQSLIAFNKQVAREDDILTDSVQRGLIGGLPERGRFLTNSEHLVIHFQRMIVNAVSGRPVLETTTTAAAS
jgi:phenylpropionate dioxygenase-like ring-hydroxylating dioxygenase large terminal subunit